MASGEYPDDNGTVTGSPRKVAFIGLGKMGAGMCGRIQKAGFELTVFNRTPSKTKPFTDAGARLAASPREAVSGADVVLTSLMDDESVLGAVLGEDGILAGLQSGAIHVGTTTVLPRTAAKLGEIHRHAGSRYVSGPVLGRPDAAASGELRTFLSGDVSAIEECSALVAAYASLAIGMGADPAASMAMKVCANYIAATQIELMGEVYAFAEKSGLPLDFLVMAFHSTFAEPTLKMYAEKIRNRDFDSPGFELSGGLKDLGLFQQAFTDAGVVPGIANVAKDKLIIAMAHGLAHKDWSATYEISRLLAGIDSQASKESPGTSR